MAIKIGINGYGRIGRNVMRAIHEYGRSGEFDVVALNDLGEPVYGPKVCAEPLASACVAQWQGLTSPGDLCASQGARRSAGLVRPCHGAAQTRA